MAEKANNHDFLLLIGRIMRTFKYRTKVCHLTLTRFDNQQEDRC